MKLKRWLKFWWQRRTRGFDDSETWNLDQTFAKFILPRLKKFQEINKGSIPSSIGLDKPIDQAVNEWQNKLSDMIYAFEMQMAPWEYKENYQRSRIRKGLKLFAEHYSDLWW